jgi:homoserine kinase
MIEKAMKYLIRVPATTANLGPGFDCLGLALDLWNDVEISSEGQGLSIEIKGVGSDQLPRDSTNAVFSSMKKFADYHEKDLPKNLKIVCKNHIPLGSGLGSSSAAAVAGILAATAILGLPTDLESQLKIATQIEGHPDNVAPCILGGLTATILENDQVIARNLPVSSLNLVLVHPHFLFPTQVARAALPKQISYSDAIFNISHSILVIEALRNGDMDLLRIAMRDKLHQPYRLPLIPGASAAIQAAAEAGAVVTILSGAGPSLLSFSPSPDKSTIIANTIQSVFAKNHIVSELFFPAISMSGAYFARVID